MIWNARIWLTTSMVAAATTAVAAAVIPPKQVEFEDGIAVAESLTGEPGDPTEGRKVFANRGLGNCLACHAVSDQSEQLFHGEVGPPLDGVGDRWSEAELRGIVVNSKKVFSDQTIMPGFYTLDVGVNVREDLIGETILTAQQVEDVVAYLKTLTEE